MKVIPENDGASVTATIEFDSAADVLTAQTKDRKTFDGNAIEVDVGTDSTLFVTNFPPTADENLIREKFKKVLNIHLILRMIVADRLTVWRNYRHSLSLIKVQYPPPLLLHSIQVI